MITTLAAVVIALLGLGIATRYLVRRAEQTFPPQGQIIEAGGLRQHVLAQGNGPQTLVMIHGAYGAAGDFAASLIPALAGRYRCIAIDRPGHGYTARGDAQSATPAAQAYYLHAALQRLGVQRPLLLGFSFGGAVALAYALAYPGDLAGLVLIGPASHPWRDGPALPFGLADMPVLGRLLRNTIVTPLGAMLKNRVVTASFAPEPVPAAFAQAPVALGLRPDSYAATTADIRGLNDALRAQAPRYPALAVPVEIVAAPDDRAVTTTLHAQRLADEIPGAILTLTESGGHLLHFSRPSAVLQAIDRAAARSAVTAPQISAAVSVV